MASCYNTVKLNRIIKTTLYVSKAYHNNLFLNEDLTMTCNQGIMHTGKDINKRLFTAMEDRAHNRPPLLNEL